MDLSLTARIGDKVLRGLLGSVREQIVAITLSGLAIIFSASLHRLSLQAIKDNAWETFLPWIWILCALIFWHIGKGSIAVYKEEQTSVSSSVLIIPGHVQRSLNLPPLRWRLRLYAVVLAYLSLPVSCSYLVWEKAIEKTEISAVPDVRYPLPPPGKLQRVEGMVEVPSSQLCVGMSDAAQIDCLCPRPLKYNLTALSTPNDNNYATNVEIHSVREPIYKLRIFSRTSILVGSTMSAFPYGKDQAAVGVGEFEWGCPLE